MENNEMNTPWETPPARPASPSFPSGNREMLLAAVLLLLSVGLCNCVFYAGFNLGYALCGLGILAASAVYVLRRRPSGYCVTLLALSAVILASFVRSDDGFVKFMMLCFVAVAVNVALALGSGRNRHDPAGFLSLLDAPRTFFSYGFGEWGASLRGLFSALKHLTGKSKTGGAVLLGLVIAVPVLAVMIPLLTSADAAFDGLLSLLPEMDFREFFTSVLLGCMAFPVVYSRCTGLRHGKQAQEKKAEGKYMNHITILTALSMVCLLYGVYLLSQLAYFVGGFSGILPKEFTMAEYARRGFFEMATLCGINLGIIALSVGLVRKEPKAPLALRLECLFVGLITLFLVVSASAKMGMYIGSYGLTRLRVLTEVIMVFLGLATAMVCLWLFVPKFAYMKAVLILALVMGAAVSWTDVDTLVARYNVRAYQSGKLDTVDVAYLATLSDGVVPYLEELTRDENTAVRAEAHTWLTHRYTREPDIRSWNITAARAWEILSGSDSK